VPDDLQWIQVVKGDLQPDLVMHGHFSHFPIVTRYLPCSARSIQAFSTDVSMNPPQK
jgi:hypothetical protein